MESLGLNKSALEIDAYNDGFDHPIKEKNTFFLFRKKQLK